MERSVGRLVSILYRKNMVYLNMTLKQYQITSAEQPFLMYLYHQDGISQDELSNYLIIDKASTTRSIQSLMSKGFIRKEKDAIDKRYNRIFLTEKAHQLKDGIVQQLNAWNDFLTEDLDIEETNTMFHALEAMTKKVEQTNFKEKWGTSNGSNKSAGD